MRINLIYKGSWTLYTALLILLLAVFLLGYHLSQATNGTFSLPHDAAFLQLSTAKTLAFTHTWGISKDNFEAASPSLLYPLLLAIAFFIFGAHLIVAILVNTAIATLLLICIDKWLKKSGVRPLIQLFILLSVILLSPLPLMIIYGMERTLLLLLAFLIASRLFNEWDQPAFSRRTMIYCALVIATSYEGLLLIAVACALLLWQHKWPRAFELCLWALLPLIIFGFIALGKRAYFFPNPWVVAFGSQFSYDWLIGCCAAMIVPLARQRLNMRERPGQWMIATTWIVIILLFTRNVYAARDLSRSSISVFRREYLVGKFVHRYFDKYSILSDDIGALSYEGEGLYTDLTGVGSVKIAWNRNADFFGPGLIRLLNNTQGFRIAIVSEVYEHCIPEDWIKVASWSISDYEDASKKTIFFFGRSSNEADDLFRHLKEYSYFLSHEIVIKYFYALPKPPAK